MRKKRRSRSYKHLQRRNAKPEFMPVILILCLSVGCGYATAKYVVDPVVNYVPQIAAESEQQSTAAIESEDTSVDKKIEESANVIEDEVKVEETKAAGYAVQFGCYSSKSAAEAAMADLGISGLQIIEQDKMYKITGEVFNSKDKAKLALKDSNTDKAFVTTIYK